MSHNIDMSNGRANIAFIGEKPWHGLGVEMPSNSDLNEWRKAAGLDFIAKAAPVQYGVDGSIQTFDSKRVLYRDDTKAPLGVVSEKYKIVQPAEIVDFFADFAKKGDMKLEVCGSILGGRRIWALAKLDMEIRVKGQDVIRPYFNLTTSFDGETGTTGKFTTTRVVCNNTLDIFYREMAADGLRKKGSQFTNAGFSVGHRSEFDAEMAKAYVAKLAVAATQFEEDANKMSDRMITGDEALRFFVGLVGVEDEKGKDLTRQSKAKIDRMMALYNSGPGAGYRAAANTVWGAMNAVTRWVDHEAKERTAGGRLASAWYGAGKDLKSKAYKVAMAVADGELALAA